MKEAGREAGRERARQVGRQASQDEHRAVKLATEVIDTSILKKKRRKMKTLPGPCEWQVRGTPIPGEGDRPEERKNIHVSEVCV